MKLIWCIVLVMALPGIASAGNVSVTLVGVNPLTINIKGDAQDEEAGNISIYLYFRDDNTTDLDENNVDASQLENTWAWGTSFRTKMIETGAWSVGGHNFTRRLYYDNSGISSLDDKWTTSGVNAIICTFTSVGSGHVYAEVSGEDGLADWNGGSHNVTYVNQDTSLPVELSSFTASTDDAKVTLKWETASEVGNIGFYVYRGETADGLFKKVSKLIEGAGNSGIGNSYEYIDKNVELNKTYFYYLEDVDIHGVKDKSDTIQVTMKPPKSLPIKEYRLFQNYPNPFNPETWIPFQLPEAGEVTIRIYNVAGQLIRTIQLGSKQSGVYIEKSSAAHWGGRNDMGEEVSSGVYFYELRTRTFRAIRKMILLK